jgi:hypothetical protein
VLRWTGRPALARDALHAALAAEPGDGDARSQLRWVGAELAASAEPTAVISTDSDDNRSAYYATTAGSGRPGPGRVLVTGSLRHATLGRTRGRSTGARVVAGWSGLAGRLALRGEAGASRLASETGGGAVPVRTVAALGAWASGQVARGLTVEGG